MKMIRVFAVLILISQMLLISCVSNKKENKTEEVKPEISGLSVPGPSAVVYKTKADYSKNVAVTLSEDKTKVISYPAIQDIKDLDKTLPIVLENGYLLDQRGLRTNSAFLSLSYEEYMNLEKQPSAVELFDMVIDNDPFVEFHKLKGIRLNKDTKEKVNSMILEGKLKE
jgi:hypothetical protein